MGCSASRSNAVADGVVKTKPGDAVDGAPAAEPPPPSRPSATSEADGAAAAAAPATDSQSATATGTVSAQPQSGLASAGPSSSDLQVASPKVSANGSARQPKVKKKQAHNHMTLDEWFNYSFEITDVTSRAPPKQIPRSKTVIGPVTESAPKT